MNNKAFMVAISVIALSLSTKPIFKSSANKQLLDQITTENTREFISVKNAAATPNIQKPHGYVSASALLWNVTTDIQKISLQTTSDGSNSTIKAKPSEWGWNWGAKATLGFRCCDDDWDLAFDFAYLQSYRRYKNNYVNGQKVNNLTYGNVVIYGTSLSQNDDNAIEAYSYRSLASFNYYDGDMQLSREYFVSKRLSIKPLAGVKGVYFNNKYSLNYQAQTSTGNLFSAKQRNNYWGVGPQVGSNFRFGFTKHFSLGVQLDGAVLWGKISSKNTTTNLTKSTYVQTKIPVYQMVPNVNTQANFVYDTNFDSNTKNFALSLGYENRYFWNNTNTLFFILDQKGSTSLQGFNAGITFSY